MTQTDQAPALTADTWYREGELLYTVEPEGRAWRNRLMVRVSCQERYPGAELDRDALLDKLHAHLQARLAVPAPTDQRVREMLEWAFGEVIHCDLADYLGKVVAGCFTHYPHISGDDRLRLDPKQRKAVDDIAARLILALSSSVTITEGETPVAESGDAWRGRVQLACDLLAERTYGNAARSPGHNARVVLEKLLSATPTQPAAEMGAQGLVEAMENTMARLRRPDWTVQRDQAIQVLRTAIVSYGGSK